MSRKRPLSSTRGQVVAAVIATAWLATRAAEQTVRNNAVRSLEDDATIYQTLIEYGAVHTTWEHADPTVLELSQRFHRRVAIAEGSGRLLADSDRAGGTASRDLPSRPSARLDAINPALTGTGSANDVVSSTEQLDAVRACLASAGLTPIATDGSITTRERTDQAEAALGECFERAVAPPALLYLGTSTDINPLAGPSARRTLSLAATILVVAAALAWWLGALVTRPLRRLTKAAGRVQDGDWDTRLEESGSDDVVAVSRSFNAMTRALQRNEAQRRQMVSDVAHELGNPLVTIAGTLAAIEDGVYDPSPPVLASLSDDVGHLARLVRDLQDLAVADAGGLRVELQPVELTVLAAGVADAYRPVAAAADITVAVTGANTSLVLADAPRLRQMLGNLMSNAIRHTPPGGTVEIIVGPGRIAVADTGEGIPDEQLDHVFDRFWRADTSRTRTTGGAGLGLAITRELAIAHGAELSVHSTVGTGTTFTIGGLQPAP